MKHRPVPFFGLNTGMAPRDESFLYVFSIILALMFKNRLYIRTEHREVVSLPLVQPHSMLYSVPTDVDIWGT